MSLVSSHPVASLPDARIAAPAKVAAPRAATLVLMLAITGGVWPLLVPYFRDLGERPPYALWPMLIVAAAVLGASRLRELPASHVQPGRWRIAGALLTLALLLLTLGTLTYVRWLAAPATLLALAGLVWRVGGIGLARALAPAGVLLLTIVPPPARGETTLTLALQRFSVQTGSTLLDLLGIDNVRAGNVLELANHRLLIEEACSGINSIVAMTAFTLLAGFWRRRPIGWTLALLPIGLIFVLALNIVRITGGAALLAWRGINLFEGSVHEWFGLVLFAGAIGLVLSADLGIELLAGTKDRVPAAPPVARRERSRPAIAWMFAAAFVGVGAFAAWHLRDCWPTPRLAGDARFHVPSVVGEWTLQPLNGDDGDAQTTTTAKHTRHWTYRAPDGTTAEVAIAYPFTIWFHDPRACYAAAGWNAGIFTPLSDAPYQFQFDMRQVGGRHGTVFFGDFFERGEPQYPFEYPTGGWLAEHLALTRRAAFYRPACEVQTLVSGTRPMDEAQRAKTAALFQTVWATLREQVIAQAGEGGSR